MGVCSSKIEEPKDRDVGQLMRESAKYHKEQGGTSLHFTRLELKKLISIYSSLQADETSAITKSKFQDSLQLSDTETDLVFTAFDSDNSGTIDLKEMISGFSFVCKGSNSEKFGFLFRLFDTDGNMELDKYEFTNMLEHLSKQVEKLEVGKYHRKFSATCNSDTNNKNQRHATNNNNGNDNKPPPPRTLTLTNIDSYTDGDDGIGMKENEHEGMHPPKFIRQVSHADMADAAFQEADGNGDGRISIDEFDKWVQTNPLAIEFMENLRASCNRICGIEQPVYTERQNDACPEDFSRI